MKNLSLGLPLPKLLRFMSESKPVILTCAQPSGQFTLGNYLGAIRNWTRYLEDYHCYFGMVDMHAITVDYVPAELRRNTLSGVALYMACGLDPSKCHLFVQSHVIGHAELSWILGCIAPIGELQRMTQFKEKAAKLGFQISDGGGTDLKFSHEGARQGASINSGLLFYPVLMAADILLYNAQAVPVGEDQRQHLELARELARRFNSRYSETFHVPEPVIPETGARIMSLQDPLKKMSKSDTNQAGTLYLLDTPDQIKKKIGSAVTDSERTVRFDPVNKPGIANLLTILAVCTNRSMAEVEAEASSYSYAELKAAVTDAVVALFEPVQVRYAELMQNPDHINAVLREGAEAAQKTAYKTLRKVYRKVGFLERS
jgi:tryptophanyl-tRNA synthetase